MFNLRTILSGVTLTLTLAFSNLAAAADSPQYYRWLAETDYHYLDPAKFHITEVLAPPPADDSLITEAELETLMQLQRLRSATEVLRVRSEVQMTPEVFANVAGDWFQPERLPLTMTLLQRVKDDCYKSISAQKKQWPRLRPYRLDPRLEPCVELPGNDSYPSGHTELGALWGAVLSSLAPAGERGLILARGWEIGDDRMLAGVHYPSDVAAGRLATRELHRLMRESRAFQRDYAAAQKEIAKALQKNDLTPPPQPSRAASQCSCANCQRN